MAMAVNVIAWAIGIALTFVLLPRSLRPLAIVIGSFAVYISYAVGGVTDALFVPLLIGAVYQWDRFARDPRTGCLAGPDPAGPGHGGQTDPVAGASLPGGRHRHRGPPPGRSLGRPFRTTGRYLGIALAAFAIPNLPFIVMAPHAWVSGVLTPIASHTVPAGQGLIGLTLFLGLGGGSWSAYTVALLVVFLALWLTYVATYPALKAWAVVCPAIVLFFSARSFGSYLVTLLPAAGGGGHLDRLGSPRARRNPAAVAPLALGGRGRTWQPRLLAVAAIFASSAPAGGPDHLGSHHRPAGHRGPAGRGRDQPFGPVRETLVHGRERRPAHRILAGPRGASALPPGGHAHYTLLAPNFFAQPPITGGFQVIAFSHITGHRQPEPAVPAHHLHLEHQPERGQRRRSRRSNGRAPG